MSARPVDFFISAFISKDGDVIARKARGIVKEVGGRLIGAKIHFKDKQRNFPEGWDVFDIETGIFITATSSHPKSKLRYDREIYELIVRDFERFIANEKYFKARERCIEAIKKAYDEYSEIKKQVFGEERT